MAWGALQAMFVAEAHRWPTCLYAAVVKGRQEAGRLHDEEAQQSATEKASPLLGSDPDHSHTN